jgi:MSHA biogenesis protein MshG
VPFYAYKGRNARGEMLQGTIEGADAGAIASQLFSTGITPVDIVEAKKPVVAANEEGWVAAMLERKVSSLDVQMFCRQMYTLLKSGVPIMRGLAGLQESATNKAFARVIGDLRESLDSGRELSSSMRRHPEIFNNFFLSMVRVGEMTGRLEDVFLRLFDHLEFDREMRQRVKSALRYPSFVIIAMIIAIVVVNIFVIPQFQKVFDSFHTELPLMTRILINSSQFTTKYWPFMLACVVMAIFGFRAWIGTEGGRYEWDRRKLKLPIAGKIMMKGTMARFARSFSLSSRSGVPIVQALTTVSQTVDNASCAPASSRCATASSAARAFCAPPARPACSRPSCCR